MKRHKNQFGFTMIEVMVVLLIIGVLAVLGGASYTNSLKRARDSRRISDLKAMQKGFELYYVDNNSSYADCATMGSSSIFPKGLPVDPRGNDYISGLNKCFGDQTRYCVCASMEDAGKNANSTNLDCNYGSGTKAYYCVSSLQ